MTNRLGMLKRFCAVWVLYWFIYVVQPVHSIYPATVGAFLLQALFVINVALFYVIGTLRGIEVTSTRQVIISKKETEVVNFIIVAGISISIFGTAFLLYDKIGIQGIDYSRGLALARQEWRVLGEVRSNAASSIYSALGYIFGGAYFLSFALSVSRTYPLSDGRRFLYILTCLVLLLLNSAITGGRSSILLALFFVAFGYFSVGHTRNNSLFNRKIYSRGFKTLLCACGAYTLYIFYLRALASDQFVGIYSLYFLDYLGLAPSEWFAKLVYETDWGGGLALINLAVAYLTHSLATTAAILQTSDHSGNVMFVNFMAIGSKFGLADGPEAWFLAGRFASLPGALFLQFGALGLLIGSASLGFYSGTVSKLNTLQPGRPIVFFLCSIGELNLLMSPILFAAEFLFFPSVVVGGFLIIFMVRLRRSRHA